MDRQEQLDYLRENEAVLYDEFEDALIGVSDNTCTPIRAIYDSNRCVEILMSNSIDDYEDACEYFEYNYLGAYLGESTPIFTELVEDSESELE